MWHMPWIFWVFVMVMVLRATRYRRWRRWEMAHAGWGWGPPPWVADRWMRRSAGEPPRPSEPAPRAAADPSYVESLESRIAQLEERLDFTERLLSGRRDEPVAAPKPE